MERREDPLAGGAAPGGTQALMRALDIIDVVAEGQIDLAGLTSSLGLSRSTTHRLAASLVARGYLRFTPGQGYTLGAKLLDLGARASAQTPLTRVARPHLQQLAARTLDTVHLGILEDHWALYLDKIAGQRRFEISSRIGERHPVWSTGLGKALILGDDTSWQRYLTMGLTRCSHPGPDPAEWLARMRVYADLGYALDLEENESQVRCVAAPVRDAGGAIVAAISVSSAAHYMDEARMRELSVIVVGTAERIAAELGWHTAATMVTGNVPRSDGIDD